MSYAFMLIIHDNGITKTQKFFRTKYVNPVGLNATDLKWISRYEDLLRLLKDSTMSQAGIY